MLALSRPYPARYQVPVLRAVDPAIFTMRYFTDCLGCGFCHDWCCQFGVDADRWHVDQILAHAAALEQFTGTPRDRWFTTRVDPDPDAPGGSMWRTAVVDGRCVFLNRAGRGCQLHRFCLEQGIDPHDLKPLVDGLFPLTYEGDVLCAADEVLDGDLVCLDTGPTLYRGVRDSLRYYFGDDLVTELDGIEAGR
ncbi:MAG TPA: hypothetical protein VMH88_07520 [Gemmatimonadales bacterium]|nr:hypothetical protein [Gemmatimonadales bacterium]